MICFEFVEGLIYNKRRPPCWNNANARTTKYNFISVTESIFCPFSLYPHTPHIPICPHIWAPEVQWGHLMNFYGVYYRFLGGNVGQNGG